MNQDPFKSVLELFGNPLFQQGFADFFFRAQQEGIEAARQFWDANRQKHPFAGNANELYEQMMDFYSTLGFVAKAKYDRAIEEKEQLAKENELLKKALRDLNSKIFAEGTVQAQEIWKETVQKQMEMSTELAKGFFDLFKSEDTK